jgi:prepilin-type N-terminal cleavage/methylation domain-containing protein
MRRRFPSRRSPGGGFTLLELMLVVFIIGVLSSLIGTAYMRNVKRARTSEAVGELQKMWTGSISYYESDHASSGGTMVNKQFPQHDVTAADGCGDFFDTAVVEPDCCDQPGQHCAGNNDVYWKSPLWQALQFNLSDAHLYVPHFAACPDPTKNMWMEVWGDLDCDGLHSTFTRMANLGPTGDVEGYLTPAVVNEIE